MRYEGNSSILVLDAILLFTLMSCTKHKNKNWLKKILAKVSIIQKVYWNICQIRITYLYCAFIPPDVFKHILYSSQRDCIFAHSFIDFVIAPSSLIISAACTNTHWQIWKCHYKQTSRDELNMHSYRIIIPSPYSWNYRSQSLECTSNFKYSWICCILMMIPCF